MGGHVQNKTDITQQILVKIAFFTFFCVISVLKCYLKTQWKSAHLSSVL